MIHDLQILRLFGKKSRCNSAPESTIYHKNLGTKGNLHQTGLKAFCPSQIQTAFCKTEVEAKPSARADASGLAERAVRNMLAYAR